MNVWLEAVALVIPCGLIGAGGYAVGRLRTVADDASRQVNGADFRAGFRAGTASIASDYATTYSEGHERGYRQGVVDGFGQAEASRLVPVDHRDAPMPKEYRTGEYDNYAARSLT